ncbi:MAG: amidohydrolase family protein [Gemmatimonadaceae bacterium]
MIALMSLLAAAAVAASDTTSYVVLNHGRLAGDLKIVSAGDSTVSRWIFTDRNRGTRIETRYRFGADKKVLAADLRQIAADGTAGPALQGFTVHGDSVYNVSGGSRAGAAATVAGVKRNPAQFLGLRFGSPYEQALIANYLLKQPKMTGELLGGLAAHAEIVGETAVPTKSGRTHVRLVMTWDGAGAASNGVWLDDNGKLFATDVAWFITVRPGAEQALPALRAIELKWRNAQGEAMAKKVATPHSATFVIKNGDLFDSETGTMRPNTSVVVHDDRIAEVGPAASVAVPAGATVIDATGKTIMPGMWEMHTHLQVDNQSVGSLVQLAQGLTTVRDMASDFDVATSQRDRERKGLLASPRVVLAGFIEGPGRWAGPSDVIATTEAEALAFIARYDSAGYKQIKLYNLVQQDLVPAIAAEAHKRGMRLSGHIPRGLSVPAAVLLGYDEIQHAAFLFSTFFQDSLYVPTMRAYSAVATAVAPNFDVDGPQMTELVSFLHDHHTVIDGTFNIWIGGSAALVGAGGSTNQEKADAAYLRLIKKLYDADVTLVAGTDNSYATTYHREIELYEKAGIPAPRVLQIATIGSARVMKDDANYGSIATGKVADIIIVNGKPAEHVADIEKVETVIRAGRVYNVKDLLNAVSGQK